MRKQQLRLRGIISCPRQKLRELSRQAGEECDGPKMAISGKKLQVSNPDLTTLLINSITYIQLKA